MGTSAQTAGSPGPGSGRAEGDRRLASEGTDTRGLTGHTLRDMFAAATFLLQQNAEAINAINVFPVPDGDTGTNMHLTMAAAMNEAQRADGETAGCVAQALARGSLLGARGNSGVILSQVLRGFAKGIEGCQNVDAGVLAIALKDASDAAFAALSEPVEGTMLTVIREAAAAAGARADSSATEALASAVEAARDALSRTPDLLPVLKEAGVVDAGGQGLCVILEAALAFLRGDKPAPQISAPRGLEASWLAATEVLHGEGEADYGYCTEFLISGSNLDRKDIQRRVAEMGTSVLVVGNSELVRVHLHTPDPGAAINFGTSLGSISGVKVDNMEAQLHAFVDRHRGHEAGETQAVSVVAVAAGTGLEAAFRSVGAGQVVMGGQTMNPSTQEILDAIEACPAEHVVVLPNNKNVVLAARQAVEHTGKKVEIVPTTSVPQGVAALLAFSPELDLESNVAAMTAAADSVRSAEVTRAVRSTTVAGRRVAEGEAIGVIDGELCIAEQEIEDAVQACVRRMVWPEATILTLYFGQEMGRQEAESLAERLHAEYPSLERVEVFDGGQPHYPYLISVSAE